MHHAKLYDKIRRSEQKHKVKINLRVVHIHTTHEQHSFTFPARQVALEVLSYHNSCSALEVDAMPRSSVPESDPTLGQYSFYALNMDDGEKVRKALFMFIDLFGLERFEYDTLIRFFITVKKNYRQVRQI